MSRRGLSRIGLTRLVVAAALGFLGGFAILIGLAWRRAGSPGLAGYLSQLGATGAASAGLYRLAVLCVAAAAALMALAWWLRSPGLDAAGLLALSAVLFAVSATVPCAQGCPIPVRDGLTTAANVVHFAASAGAFGVALGAMGSVGAGYRDPWLRRVSATTARVATLLYAVLSTLVLIVGHSVINGVVERLLALVATGWLVTCALRLGHRRVVGPRQT
ncbi:MAG: DUF998 domain-containing protein [Actinomycetota bacterium]|nr:DUF998 domain-containing protein [Actinomycetota bacterium]